MLSVNIQENKMPSFFLYYISSDLQKCLCLWEEYPFPEIIPAIGWDSCIWFFVI